jgi:lysozyme
MPRSTRLAIVCLAAAACSSPQQDPADLRVQSVQEALVYCAGPVVREGIDVSEYQGNINWPAVAASGRAFAIARINDGSHNDPYWAANWNGIKAAGMIRGAYQFFRPGSDPIVQANKVIAAVGVLGPGDLPVMLDIEANDGQPASVVVARAHQWVDAVRAGTGRDPVVYTYKSFWDVQCGGVSDFNTLPFAIAAYGPVCPNIPAPWDHWTFFQYSSTGSVPGIGGNVDLDKFNGTQAELETFASGGITADNCTGLEAHNCGAYGCGCVDHQCNGGFCAGSGCTAQHATNCGGFGCGCADGQCAGGVCPGAGCTAKELVDCGKVGCGCVDHQCNGGDKCAGTGCTWRETHDCGGYGCNCADHQCSGGFCPNTGCTGKETAACSATGCGCVDHKCSGGQCAGSGSTARQSQDCGGFGCGSIDGACNGVFCPGTGCTAKQTADCQTQGCGCADQKCGGGLCAGTGCTPHQALDCQGQDAGCSLGHCVGAPPVGELTPLLDDGGLLTVDSRPPGTDGGMPVLGPPTDPSHQSIDLTGTCSASAGGGSGCVALLALLARRRRKARN